MEIDFDRLMTDAMEHTYPVCLTDCPQEKCPCKCHERAFVLLDSAFGVGVIDGD